MARPTEDQWAELHRQAGRGEFTSVMAQAIIDKAVNWGNRFTVNYDDPRWSRIDKGAYAYVDSDATPGSYPLQGTGTAVVEFDIRQFDHEPTTEQVMAWQNEDGFRTPDRAEVETYLDAHRAQTKQYPIVGICGKVFASGGRCVWYVDEREHGRGLLYDHLGGSWDQSFRFLRVRKNES